MIRLSSEIRYNVILSSIHIKHKCNVGVAWVWLSPSLEGFSAGRGVIGTSMCRVTIQAHCLRPAVRDHSIMWEIAYTVRGYVILKPETMGGD